MIQSLELNSFRAFEHVQFEGLGRANLIIGGNNTGKTSILEGLILKLGSGQQITKLPSTFRQEVKRDSGVNYWSLLPHDRDWENFALRADGGKLGSRPRKDGQLQLWEETGEGQQVVGNIKGTSVSIAGFQARVPLGILATRPGDPAAVADLYNQIAPLNPANEDRLEELLASTIEPRLKRLRYAKPKGTEIHLVYADLGEGQMLPFTQLGQAFSRTLEVFCEIFANQPKVLLIDEIENGLYYEGLEDYWRGLYEVLEDQDVQLFATTHSRECMEAAHRAARERESYPLRYLRLDRRVDDPGKITATTFGGEEMETAMLSNFEMR